MKKFNKGDLVQLYHDDEKYRGNLGIILDIRNDLFDVDEEDDLEFVEFASLFNTFKKFRVAWIDEEMFSGIFSNQEELWVDEEDLLLICPITTTIKKSS